MHWANTARAGGFASAEARSKIMNGGTPKGNSNVQSYDFSVTGDLSEMRQQPHSYQALNAESKAAKDLSKANRAKMEGGNFSMKFPENSPYNNKGKTSSGFKPGMMQSDALRAAKKAEF